MNSRCRYAAAITAKCIAVATRPRGGPPPASIRALSRARCGLRPVQSRMSAFSCLNAEGLTGAAHCARGADPIN